MKKCQIFNPPVCLSALLLSLTVLIPQSNAGNKTGNGGDGCVAQFKGIALTLADEIEKSDTFLKKLGPSAKAFFTRARTPMALKVSISEDKLFDPQTGLPVEAINNGDSEVTVYRPWCEREIDENKVLLVLHELLGSSGNIEKSQDFLISGRFLPWIRQNMDKFGLHIQSEIFESKLEVGGSCSWWNSREEDLKQQSKTQAIALCLKAGFSRCQILEGQEQIQREAPCTVSHLAKGWRASSPHYAVFWRAIDETVQSFSYQEILESEALVPCRAQAKKLAHERTDLCRKMGGLECEGQFKLRYAATHTRGSSQVDCQIAAGASGFFLEKLLLKTGE